MQNNVDTIQRNFSDMSTEALMEEWALHAEDYMPGALEALKRELLSRGVTPAHLDQAAKDAALDAPEPGEEEVIASFDSMVFARQAQDILEQKGIESTLRGMESTIWGFEAAAAVPGQVDIVVIKRDAEAARAALQEFTPAAEEREGVKLEEPPPEEDVDQGDAGAASPKEP
jgi:hypothetical protein